MRTKLNKEKQIQINIYKIQTFKKIIISFIFISSIICINGNNDISTTVLISNSIEEEEDYDLIDCTIKGFLRKKCNITFENDNGKYLFKTNIISYIANQTIFKIMKQDDLIVNGESEIYEIMEIDHQNLYEDLTFIDFSQCINYLKLQQNLLNIHQFYVFKIEHLLPSYKIPVIEYLIFIDTGQILDCDNQPLYYKIKVKNIDEESLYLYNKSSDYYNEECMVYKSKNDTDLTLYSRRMDYNKNFMSVCEKDCDFINYNPSSSIVECKCNSNSRILTVDDLNGNDLIYFFDDDPKITNFFLLKCYFLITSKEDIIKNPGFYLTVIVAGIFDLIFFLFCIIGYRALSKRIDEAIRLKFHPNKKEDMNNKKLIIIKLNENNKKIKRRKTILNDRIPNKRKKDTEKRKSQVLSTRKKKKPHRTKSMSFSGRNMLQIEGNKKGEALNKKTTVEENGIDENIIIFENDFELNMLPFQDALKYDRRTCCQYYVSLIKNRQFLLFSLLDFNSYNSVILKKPIFFLSFIYNYGINAFFFTDEVMNKIYENEGKYDIETLTPNAVYSALAATGLLKILMILLLLSERNVLNVKNQKTENQAIESKNHALKIICVKLVFFFIINIGLLIFFMFYLTCFNALYPNTQIYLIINTCISFFISNLLTFLYSLIPALFRNDILKYKEKKAARYKAGSEVGDVQYIYNLSKFLQNL